VKASKGYKMFSVRQSELACVKRVTKTKKILLVAAIYNYNL